MATHWVKLEQFWRFRRSKVLPGMTVRAGLVSSSVLAWMRQIGLRIDDRLRRRTGVREYSYDPQCVFRMQPDVAWLDLTLTDGTVLQRGDRLIRIHLWNEQIPKMPTGGANIVWGRTMSRAMGRSLQQLSGFLAHSPEYDRVVAIYTEMAVATSGHTTQLLRIMEHFGFEIVPETGMVSWKEQLHRFGENVLGLLLVLAVNPVAARISILWRVRSTVMISRAMLDQRYGRAGRGTGPQPDRQCNRDPTSGAGARASTRS